MAGTVEQVEAPVAIQVDGAERSHVQPFAFNVEVDLAQVATLPGTLRDWSFGIGRVALRELAFEARTDDEVRRAGKG